MSNNTTEIRKKYPYIEQLFTECHGAGIDYEWSAKETKNNIICYNAYHCMNENGFYIAKQNFKVVIPKHDIMNFRVQCRDKYRYWWNKLELHACLEETMYNILARESTPKI